MPGEACVAVRWDQHSVRSKPALSPVDCIEASIVELVAMDLDDILGCGAVAHASCSYRLTKRLQPPIVLT